MSSTKVSECTNCKCSTSSKSCKEDTSNASKAKGKFLSMLKTPKIFGKKGKLKTGDDGNRRGSMSTVEFSRSKSPNRGLNVEGSPTSTTPRKQKQLCVPAYGNRRDVRSGQV